MKNQIVLGSFFGDEGKGATVQWLCKKAVKRKEKVIVARFSGGAQCGHRVINGKKEHVFSLYGSGSLLDVPTYLDENVFIDPISVRNEYDLLKSKEANPTLYINGNCRVTTPFDILANREDITTLSHGSCGGGIYHTFKRYKDFAASGEEAMNLAYALIFPRMYINKVMDYYKNIPKDIEDVDIRDLIEDFIDALSWIKKNVKIIPNDMLLHNFVFSKYDTIIWEGSQGLLLDMDYGFMPHCTPSKTGLNGIKEEYLQDAEVFLVMRTYLTRHGNGFTPIGEEYIRKSYVNLDEPTNKDTGYQGKFKLGVFNLRLLERVNDRHHLENYKYHYNIKYNVVVNHFDCLRKNFYFTINGEQILTSCRYFDNSSDRGFPKAVKTIVKSSFPFDAFYAGYSHDKIVKI